MDILWRRVAATWKFLARPRYENDGSQSFREVVMVYYADGACSVEAMDVDGDGNMDILGANEDDWEVAIYFYDGGAVASSSVTAQIVGTSTRYTDLQPVDVDGTGTIDVVASSYSDHTVAWYVFRAGICRDGSRRTLRPRRGISVKTPAYASGTPTTARRASAGRSSTRRSSTRAASTPRTWTETRTLTS